MFSESKFWEAISNNMLWLIVVPAVSTAFGLLAAQLTDRISWGNIAKSLIFMPMAISFVGASVIFKLIYDARPADVAQIGVLNAVWMQFEEGAGSFIFLRLLPAICLIAFAAIVAYVGWLFAKAIWERHADRSLWLLPLRLLVAVAAVWLIWKSLSSVVTLFTFVPPYGQPQQWLTTTFWNNFFLMAVLIWIQTGFAMVILSAALRGIPEETIEAAILDGASPWQVFWKIKVPQIWGTIAVVWTTITILVLKVFDIVLTMTNGQWGSQVLANLMFDWMFRGNDTGRASTVALVIMVLVTPIMVWNIRNARRELR
jgi:alpha-glucoside transport system permease protein